MRSLLILAILLSGCAGDSGQRIAYNALQSANQQACLKNSPDKTSTSCLKHESYDEYQQRRSELGDEDSSKAK